MKQYLIDFSGVKTHDEFYNAIIKGMEFPKLCGDNPNAVLDLMTGYIETPGIVQTIGLKKLPKSLDTEVEYFYKVIESINERYSYLQYRFIIA